MTTTNVLGVIETTDGELHMIQQEPTDGSGEALTIYDMAGSAKTLGDHLFGKVISRIALQLSDGSILTSLVHTQEGRTVHAIYGGERLAGSEDVYNIDMPVSIPVDKKTILTITTAD
jgi:hypothetical protein